jgi:hypothetical protein
MENMEKTECQKLSGRFKAMEDTGLIDVKFYVGGEAMAEQVYREVNRLYDAVEKNEFVELDFQDSYIQTHGERWSKRESNPREPG